MGVGLPQQGGGWYNGLGMLGRGVIHNRKIVMISPPSGAYTEGGGLETFLRVWLLINFSYFKVIRNFTSTDNSILMSLPE